MHLNVVGISALAMIHPIRSFTVPSSLSVVVTARNLLRVTSSRRACRSTVSSHRNAADVEHGLRMAESGPSSPASLSPLLGRGREVLSLAPMMDYTDRHMRFLLRLLTTRTVLWTEMVPSQTITHHPDDLDRVLAYNDEVEHPVVLQIGGSSTTYVQEACRLARPYKYDAINLNCGCPSDKVAGKGAFGAALMRSPSLLARRSASAVA